MDEHPSCMSDIQTSNDRGIHDGADYGGLILMVEVCELVIRCRGRPEACTNRRLDKLTVGHVEVFENDINVVVLKDKKLTLRPVADTLKSRK
jgi:hypothetical protein